jgi:hypothetical protein
MKTSSWNPGMPGGTTLFATVPVPEKTVAIMVSLSIAALKARRRSALCANGPFGSFMSKPK